MGFFDRLNEKVSKIIGVPPNLTQDEIQMLAQIMDDGHSASHKLLEELKKGFIQPSDEISKTVVANDGFNETLKHVDLTMSVIDFLLAESNAFDLWPYLIGQGRANRSLLSYTIKDALFQNNPQGWKTYCAWARKKIEWFDKEE